MCHKPMVGLFDQIVDTSSILECEDIMLKRVK